MVQPLTQKQFKTTLDQAELATLRDGNRSKHQIEHLVNRAKAAGDEKQLLKLKL